MKSILKKIVILTVLAPFAFISFGQIELDCDGNVGIGVAPYSSYKLRTSGIAKFSSGDNSFYIGTYSTKFDNDEAEDCIYYILYDDESAFLPGNEETGYLGNSEDMFYKIYGSTIYNSSGVITGSDSRLKENIRAIESPLQKIKNIRGVKYDLIYNPNPKHKESKRIEIENRSKDKIGFIAQELNEVFPEAVDYDEKADQYGVYYDAMIPILVEAIKEQQVLIENLQQEILIIKDGLDNDGLKSASIGEPEGTNELETNTLYQNSPNPFNENTKIEFYLTEETQNAILNVYDMNGTQLKSIVIDQIGYNSVILSSMEYDAGMYMYALIADGIIIDTKQMILTD